MGDPLADESRVTLMPTDQEFWDVRSKVTAALLERGAPPDEVALRDAARTLSGTLREIVADDPFWDEVAHPVGVDGSIRLASVLAVDWPLVFAEYGYAAEDARVAAADLLGTADVVLAGEPDDWARLRERMTELASVLAADADDDAAARSRGWWNRLRDRIGFGLGAVRRVSLRKLLIEMGKGALQSGAAALVTAMLGGPAFAVPQFVGTLAGRLGVALADELVRGWSDERSWRESARLRDLYADSPALNFGRYGGVIADVRLLGSATEDPVFDGVFDKVRRWVARMGLDLANAWSHVITHLGRPGADLLNGMFAALEELRSALAPFVTAARESYQEFAAAAAERAGRALGRLQTYAASLGTMLFAEGVLDKH